MAGQTEVRVRTVEEDAVRGRLVSLSESQGLTLTRGDGRTTHVSPEDLVWVDAAPAASTAPPRGFTVTLGQGDVIHGRIEQSDAESLEIDTPDFGRLTLPLEHVARIDAATAREPSHRLSVNWLDRRPASDDDRVLLTNGDVVRGFIESFGDDGLVMQTALGATTVPRATIVAVRFAAPRRDRPQPPYQMISTRDSGHLTVRGIDWKGDVIRCTHASGREIIIEAERVTRVECFGGRWEWLSRHAPISYEHTPMLAMGWDYARDANALGAPMKVAGATFTRGIGVHSRASLTFDLAEKYSRFITAYGMDDDSGPHADVTVSILVDGRPRHRAENIRRGTLHDSVRLDVTGAKRIELLVDFGLNGDIQDRFNWIEPALIR